MSDRVEVNSGAVWPDDAADVDEAVVADWFAREGKQVTEGETLCVIQVEKVDVDVPAPAAGVLETIRVGEDEAFARGAVLAEIRPA